MRPCFGDVKEAISSVWDFSECHADLPSREAKNIQNDTQAETNEVVSE